VIILAAVAADALRQRHAVHRAAVRTAS